MLPEIRTLIYASDLGEGSRPAFRAAVQQAIKHNAQIVYLHVVEHSTEVIEEMMEEYLPKQVNKKHAAQMMDAKKARIETRIHDFLASELDGKVSQLPIYPVVKVVEGEPDKVVLKTAQAYSADMIVMGDRASSSLSRIFLGSTVQKVVHHSEIPVLIVPLPKQPKPSKEQKKSKKIKDSKESKN